MGLINDFSQHCQISQLQGDVRWQGTKVELMTGDLAELGREVSRVRLAVEAISEILQTHLGVESQEIVQKMLEIDLRDGKRDGRITPTPKSCESCQRPFPATTARCIYCGHSRPDQEGVTSVR